MRYEDARAKIQTGDLIAVKRRSGPLAIATRIVTNSDYTHTGVALWIGGRLLMAQTNAGGCNIVPLSHEAEFEFDVFSCPVDRSAVEQAIWTLFGVRIAYAFFDLVRIALHIKLGIPLPQDDGAYVCSALSAMIYRQAGWQPQNLPSIPWPGAVVACLKQPPLLSVCP